ncbi:MAG TPA: hypothetical protein VHJ76_06215 [Actinomycetota bacterium]|nr:hypothetical protein [Actinomycetota bacterium]
MAVPFNVSYEIGAQTIRAAAPTYWDSGAVGVCDPELQCTGFRITEETSEITGGTTRGEVTLDGHVCVQDSSPECGNGTPFTGVMIHRRVVDTPEPYVGPTFIHVNVCLWIMSPPDQPYACDVPAVDGEALSVPDLGNVADATPQDLGLTFDDDDD